MTNGAKRAVRSEKKNERAILVRGWTKTFDTNRKKNSRDGFHFTKIGD